MRAVRREAVRGPERVLRGSWLRDRRGASGVVVTLLILLVAAGAVSMFMAVYVPIWGKDTEGQAMKRVQTQMLGLKENIDQQMLAGKGSTLTTRLTLGTEGGPVLRLTRTTGTLAAEPEKNLYLCGNATDPNEVQGRAKGYLTFSSSNRYSVDQKYHYENGALLVIQGGRVVMKAEPHLDVRRQTDGNLTASVSLVSLNGAPTSRSGTGDVLIQTTLSVYDVTSYSGGDWALGKALALNITTKYATVWAEFLNDTLSRPEAALNATTDWDIVNWSGGVTAVLYGITKLDLGIAVVEVQLEM